MADTLYLPGVRGQPFTSEAGSSKSAGHSQLCILCGIHSGDAAEDDRAWSQQILRFSLELFRCFHCCCKSECQILCC